MITVVGGVYAEECRRPYWNQVFGSAGRAAICIGADETCAVELHTVVSDRHRKIYEQFVHFSRIDFRPVPVNCSYSFFYIHQLRLHALNFSGDRQAGTVIDVAGDDVLRFGMVDVSAKVTARRAVYDPQGSTEYFSSNGSVAHDDLVYALNAAEALALTDAPDLDAAVQKIFLVEPVASAVIVKGGPFGAVVYVRGEPETHIPAYRTKRVFKIGSGDVFCAAFAKFWMCKGKSIVEACELAALSVAYYVETKNLWLPSEAQLRATPRRAVKAKPGFIYLAAPFFTLEQIWLVEEVKEMIESMVLDRKISVFSPMHDVGVIGPGLSVQKAVEQDVLHLDSCGAVLALLNTKDPGSIFEIGYACSLGKKVTIYCESQEDHHLTMFEGSGCAIFDDLASAIYNAIWDVCDA